MNRRDFIALSGAAVAASGIKTFADKTTSSNPDETPASYPPTTKHNRPNILLLMADQLRVDCIGANGNPDIKTPNLDRLARESVSFRSAYSTTPTCCPARSALLTGLGPWRHGLMGYSRMASLPYPVEKGKALAQAGYYTTSIGKNHYFPIRNPHGYHHLIGDEHCSYWFHKEGFQDASSWEERGDYESWFWSQAPDKDPHATGMGWNNHRGKAFVYPEKLHATHWTGETAVRYLQMYDRPHPFFLKVSFIRPHPPYDPPERFFNMYADAPLPEAKVGKWASRFESLGGPNLDEMWHGKMTPEQIRNSRQGYYGSVSFVDEQIGRILDVLEQRKLLDETLILFLSDHGDMLADQNLFFKSYGYEQSAHIPMMMRLPASMDMPGHAGETIANPVEIRDVLPTFLDAAGTAIPESLEGKSLLQLIRTNGHGWREYIDLEHSYPDPTYQWNGLTDGRWKYLYHAMAGDEQLFHLANDPYELNDLSAVPQYTAELQLWRGRLAQHLAERGPDWVRNGKLLPRHVSMMHSPNFPGYATPVYSFT